MPEAIRKVNVIGHQHPDTDSICAAISYAYLKNQTDKPIYEARRAGALNRETQFVLKHFGFNEPALITSVRPQIKDLSIQRQEGIDAETSLFTAWSLMRETKVDTLAITDEHNELEGIISIKDIATSTMEMSKSVISDAKTKIINILDTLQGELIVGDPEGTIERGNLVVGTSPEMMDGLLNEGDIVLVTNRYESQRFAVDAGAGVLIVCNGAQVTKAVINAAQQNGITIITTPYDTYAAARLVSLSVPVRSRMLKAENVLHFSVNTTVDDARKIITQSRHRFFPVLDEAGKYAGGVSTPNLLSVQKKHVILVDHNEKTQAVDGLDQANIMEIIDHHRIGSIETSSPALFRNEPVGCTCTILYTIFGEKGVEIPKNIAGLMMSAILSDTLCFRSPTCTSRDVHAGEALAKICGEDVDAYADAMFDAGADLTGRTAEDFFNSDFKVFSRGSVRFGVGQGSFMTENSRKAAEALTGPYLKEGAEANEIPLVFYMFTDVKSQTTEMLYWGDNAEAVVSRAFNTKSENGIATLPGVVSRKKQVTPALMTTLQSMKEEESE